MAPHSTAPLSSDDSSAQLPEEHFFEGAEKLMELWFSCSDGKKLKNADLRDVERHEWDRILRMVKCEIISVESNYGLTAYVLSESSMFISKQRFVLKTCGSTTLLHAVKPLIQLVKEMCGFDVLANFFYSRKNFERPERQSAPHNSFENEVMFLDRLFKDGAAYSFGRVNRDCWHVYTCSANFQHLDPKPDQTLELLMTDLDADVMSIFTRATCNNGKEASRLSGINTIIPKSVIDEFLFEPCGYSANGLLPNGQYWTIHITPEPKFAYVSFETNCSQDDYHQLITKVLSIFRPGNAALTIFANKASSARDVQRDSVDNWSKLHTYKRTDYSLAILDDYILTYSFYKNMYS